MKAKHLLTMALVAASTTTWAQTDVTSTYIQNATFDSDAALTENLCGYGKDMGANETSSYGQLNIAGWTSAGTGVEDSGFANSGIAGGIFEYGGTPQLRGNKVGAPAAGPDGSATKALGMFAVWGNTIQYTQSATLSAGTYNLTYTYYNQSGTNAVENLFGFITNDNVKYVGKTTSFGTGAWKTETVSFELAETTEGVISIGYVSKGAGSAANPMLFIDNVKLTSGVDKSALDKEITNANAVLAELAPGSSEYTNLAAAISTAEALVPQNIAQIEDAIANLTAAANTALSSAFNSSIFSDYEQVNPGSFGTPNQGGQHWDGTDETKYFDTWSSTAITKDYICTTTLPAGDYILRAAGRGQAGTTTYLAVGDEKVTFNNKGDVGFGIEVTGDMNFADSGNYANEGKGRGWEWRYIKFSLSEATEVKLSCGYSLNAGTWASVCEPELFADAAAKTDAEIYPILTEILATEFPSANSGTGAFQRDAAKVAIAKAEYDKYSSMTIDQIKAALKAQGKYTVEDVKDILLEVNDAKNTIINMELNAPSTSAKYSFVLANNPGWTHDGKAVTYLADDRADAGNYNIQYLTEPNANYAQAFTLVQVEGNKYILSQEDCDGNTRYICTGEPYGGNANQLRTTLSVEDALAVEIKASTTQDGVYNLWNTKANQFIGSQDAGFFTVDKNYNFSIVEASQAEVSLKGAKSSWFTFIAPFNSAIPTGVTVYAVEGVDSNDALVTSEATSIVANTPYIACAEEPTSISGWGTAKKGAYSNGILTGVYTATPAPVDSYVLQTQDDATAFYKVAEGKQPNVPANRCYITTTSDVKSLSIGIEIGEDDTPLAIQGVNAAAAGTIYNAAGVKTGKLQKGMNIIQMSDGSVQKVMVK